MASRNALRIFLLAALIKLLLVPAYHSTDFEVHRNWLAITHSLPISKWYYEDRSEWTLDYPPFFAWFEFTLSQVAQFFDPRMLDLDNLGYASFETVLFQRLTVITTEVVLFLSVLRVLRPVKDSLVKDILTGLIFLNPGILFVDHIHFQYNGFLYGIQLYSIAAFQEGQHLIGGALFAVVLNFKHIYLYQAPAYFVYLLSGYCFSAKSGLFQFSLQNFVSIGAVTLAVFALSFGPFAQHLPQILSRLFPFKRGLCHAYWAPNFWAVYSFADRLALFAMKAFKIGEPASIPSLTRGLVGDTSFGLLPAILPIHTLVLTLLGQLPILFKLWRKPTRDTFVESLILCGFSSFLFGWHVHEKAILLVLIPFSLIAHESQRHARTFLVLAGAGYGSLFPLIYQPTELVTKFAVLGLYMSLSYSLLSFLLNRSTGSPLRLSWAESVYLLGMVVLQIYAEVIHPLLFCHLVNLEFLPLMAVSVYSAVGVMYAWFRFYWDTLVLSKDKSE
ncbi:glycosyl transferase [Polychytrium aggregatum]|uniref:glycosyl transferase n=1 Tax=Polychytrium aggregatum TaxID=110093 RepID=UPI0022FE036A|nr:glycosyl transferase [Polychytrium aggregatum]KAI9209742.1 glycosyl transferase [Polychytrium aggregatum]